MSNQSSSIEKCPEWPMLRSDSDPFNPPPDLVPLRDDRIFRVRMRDGTTPWVITKYDDQRAAFNDERLSADLTKPGYPQTSAVVAEWFRRARPLNVMDNPEHDILRRSLAGSFTVKRMEGLRSWVQQIVDDLIDQMLAKGGPTDLVQAFSLKLPSIVVCEMLGVSYEDHDTFIAATHVLHAPEATVEDAMKAVDYLIGYLSRVIEARGSEPGDDLIGKLTADQYLAGKYSLEQTAGIALQMLIAGHDTTANMITMGVLLLLLHPDQLEQMKNGSVPLSAVVDELMRFVTPAHGGARRVAIADIEIGSQTIRAGEGVIMPTVLSNREPGIFERPDEFDITRSARHHMSFGYGIHQCLGAPLARLELQIAYKSLFERLPGLRLACDVSSLKFKREGIIYGTEDLSVTWGN